MDYKLQGEVEVQLGEVQLMVEEEAGLCEQVELKVLRVSFVLQVGQNVGHAGESGEVN